MSVDDDASQDRRLSSSTIDLAIRIGFLGLLGYLALRIITPFVTIALWSAVLAVALHPLFKWLTQYFRPRLSAALVTLLCLLIVIGPVAWLWLCMGCG